MLRNKENLIILVLGLIIAFLYFKKYYKKEDFEVMFSPYYPISNQVVVKENNFENEIEDFRFATTGEYGGIGATIKIKDQQVLITELYENSPATTSDLRVGDQLISIDGITLENLSIDEIGTLLKGAAESVGTKSSYVIPMFTLDEKFVGTLGIDYVTRKKKLTKDQWEKLQIKAGRIAGYISSYLEK
mgnify:CR=1 FL=1